VDVFTINVKPYIFLIKVPEKVQMGPYQSRVHCQGHGRPLLEFWGTFMEQFEVLDVAVTFLTLLATGSWSKLSH